MEIDADGSVESNTPAVDLLDKINSVACLEREELEDRWGTTFVVDHSFELFDKAVAFSLSDNDDGKENAITNSILQDFVLYMSEIIRPRELYMMAVDKLSSVNIVSVDNHSLCLLYYTIQLSLRTLSDETKISGMHLVLSACCSRCSRAKEDSEDDDDDAASPAAAFLTGPTDRMAGAICLAISFLRRLVNQCLNCDYSTTLVSCKGLLDGLQAATTLLKTSRTAEYADHISPFSIAITAYLLTLSSECVALFPTASLRRAFMGLIAPLVFQYAPTDTLLATPLRARRFLLDWRKFKATQESRCDDFSKLIWNFESASGSAESTVILHKHKATTLLRLTAELAHQVSWDCLVPWDKTTDSAIAQVIRDYRLSVEYDDSACPSWPLWDRKSRDTVGILGDMRWTLTGCGMVMHFFLASIFENECSAPELAFLLPRVYSREYLARLAGPMILPLLRHGAVCREGLELASRWVDLNRDTGNGLIGLFLPSFAIEADERGGVDPLSSLLSYKSENKNSRESSAWLIAAAHAFTMDALSISQSLVSALATIPDDDPALRVHGLAALRGVLDSHGATSDHSRFLLLKKLVTECPYESLKGLLLDYSLSCVQKAAMKSSQHERQQPRTLPSSWSPISAGKGKDLDMRLEIETWEIVDAGHIPIWSPVLVELLSPVLEQFLRRESDDEMYQRLCDTHHSICACIGIMTFILLKIKHGAVGDVGLAILERLRCLVPAFYSIKKAGARGADDGLSIATMNAAYLLEILDSIDEK